MIIVNEGYKKEAIKVNELLNEYKKRFGKKGTHYSRKLLADHAYILRNLAVQEAEADPHGSTLYSAIQLAWNAGFMSGYKAGGNDVKQQKAKKESVPVCGMIRK